MVGLSRVSSRQHNEHRHLWANLLFLADFEFFRGTSWLTWSGLLVTQLSLGAVIGTLITAGHAGLHRAFGVMLSIALIVSPFNIDNLILPFHVSIPLVCLLALLAFYWTIQASLAATWHGASRATSIACLMILICPYAMANGLIAPVIAVALALSLRANRITVALIAFVATGIFVAYFWHWTLPRHHAELLPSGSRIGGLWQIVAHSLVLLGAPGLLLGSIATGVLGLAGFALWLALLVAVWQQIRLSRAQDANLIALFALATFVLGTAVMIALGRAGAGLGQALSTRYATFSLVFWLAVLGAMWRWRTNALERINSGVRASRDPRLAVVLSAFAYGSWRRVVESWRTQVSVSDQATADLLAGQFDPSTDDADIPPR